MINIKKNEIMSDIQKNKIRISNLGQIRTEQTKRNISLSKKNKKNTLQHNKNISIGHRNSLIKNEGRFKKGQIPYNYNKHQTTKYCLNCNKIFYDKSQKYCSFPCYLLNRKSQKGKFVSLLTRQKQSVAKKGKKQTKEHIRNALSYQEKRSFPERLLFNKVKEIYPFAKANEKIETKNSWRKPDILLDKFNITIEFDGTHFHKIENDIERDKALVEVGYKRLHYRGYQPDNDEIINDVNNLLENNINGLYKEEHKTILQII
jgi:very-short-patch-repair endonuclease